MMPLRISLAAWLLLFIGAPPAAAATLSGTVRDTTGTPIAGARVQVVAGFPLHGMGAMRDVDRLEPTARADCGRLAFTDSTGHFELAALEDSVRFRLLFSATDHAPVLKSRVSPLSGPIETRLVPVDVPGTPDWRIVTGRVLDPQDRPIEDARVYLFGWKHHDDGTWGTIDDWNLQAVSDSLGRFTLVVEPSLRKGGPLVHAPRDGEDGATLWQLEIEAGGWAPAIAGNVPSGRGDRPIHLGRGAVLTGRLTHGGEGLQDVVVVARPYVPGVRGWHSLFPRSVAAERRFINPVQVATDQHGDFRFEHLPADLDFVVYAPMESYPSAGGAPLRKWHTGADGSSGDLGELAPEPRRRLTGRVRLDDGRPAPAGTRVVAGRYLPELGRAFDSAIAKTDSLGHFDFVGLPAESLAVGVSLKGWRPPEKLKPVNIWHGIRGVMVSDRGNVNLDLRLERVTR